MVICGISISCYMFLYYFFQIIPTKIFTETIYSSIMSTAMTFGQKQFIPTPPDKGSFPLDHDGACKKTMTKYMKCLFDNNSNNSMCRDEAKSYLACRMENNLMAKEDWSKLGFQESDDGKVIKESTRQ